MKKSELLRYAMDAVLDSNYNNDIKLEVLRMLIEKEEVERFSEALVSAVTDE
jgi:Arc/MetJ-type ribon-helix-helix transcriptional regulator